MLAQFLITFREAFEAAVLVAIVLIQLVRTGRRGLIRSLILGASVGVLVSVLAGLLIRTIYIFGGFKDIFEILSTFVAVAILTSVIYWTGSRGVKMVEEVKVKVARSVVSPGASFMISLLGFTLVFREGMEAVLFMMPLLAQEPWPTLVGSGLGIIGALLLSSLVFIGGLRLSFRVFFRVMSILLILVAGGLLGQGVHELVEYGLDNGWNLDSIAWTALELPIGEDNIMHEEGLVGSVLAALLGYSTRMEFIRLVVQGCYIAIALSLTLWGWFKRRL